jgi:hypothetical protein
MIKGRLTKRNPNKTLNPSWVGNLARSPNKEIINMRGETLARH